MDTTTMSGMDEFRLVCASPTSSISLCGINKSLSVISDTVPFCFAFNPLQFKGIYYMGLDEDSLVFMSSGQFIADFYLF